VLHYNNLKVLIHVCITERLEGYFVACFQRGCGLEAQECGIEAGRMYCRLVQVPGSAAFKVFHPELFEKSMDYVKKFLTLGTSCFKLFFILIYKNKPMCSQMKSYYL